MLISDNIYQVGYYLKEHPENTKYELFFASSDKNAIDYINKMNMTNKVVFELKKQVLAFKTIREWSELPRA
jgi:hypothetical protein